MGKGFNNYMSKKDFHPSAIWNLRKVWMAEQKLAMDKKKQEELRAAYDKEQEILNNKALLGDEKARLGLAFMYDAPAGIRKEEKEAPAVEPKFEWQRKFNAPREDWAKGDESIADQPFGIQVRNVRCVKCHTWGHINTDRECPLYNMSGNHENPGVTTNPSEIIREMRKNKVYTCPTSTASSSADAKSKEKLNPNDLMSEMRTEYGLTLKRHIVDGVRADDALDKLTKTKEDRLRKDVEEKDQQKMMFEFLQGLSEKERSQIFNKFFESDKVERKQIKRERSSSKNSDSESEAEKQPIRRRRHDTDSEEEDVKPFRTRKDEKRERKRHDSNSDEDMKPFKPRKPEKEERQRGKKHKEEKQRDKDRKEKKYRKEEAEKHKDRKEAKNDDEKLKYRRRSRSPRRRSPSLQRRRRSPSPVHRTH